jgi:hypothetical protein
MERIKDCAHKKSVIFISTPERDLVRGFDSFGPPANPLHVREWNQLELAKYVSSKGFKILSHQVLDAKKLSLKEKFESFLGKLNNKTCQLIVCELNG